MFTYKQIQSLSDLEFDVYNYIIKNVDKVLNMKIRELAQEAHVSTTVVLHFCKKVDCSGYSEFKVKLKMAQVNNKEILNDSDIEPVLDYLHQQNNNEKNQKQLQMAVDLIYKAKRVIFIGAGPSGVIAKYGAIYLSNMGKPTQYIDSPYYSVPDEDCTKSVIIALSVSGETLSTVNRINRFKELNSTIISITNTDNNTIVKMSDLSFSYYVPTKEFHIIESMEQLHVNATTQIPVIYFIETIAKQLYIKLKKV